MKQHEIETKNKNLNNNNLEISKYKKWYVINCYSGHEEHIRNDLIQRVEFLQMKNIIFDIKVIKKTIIQKNNQKMVEKNLYPGYIFINMIMNDEAWYIVRNTTGVTGFVGSSGKGTKPFPLSETEVNIMLNKTIPLIEKKVKKIYIADFQINDYVKILSGPFANIEGQVTNLDIYKGITIVNIEMFGRLTPTEFDFKQCKKIS